MSANDAVNPRGGLWTVFVVSMLLMPFSSGTEVAVVAYGLPFFALLAVAYLSRQIAEPYVPRSMKEPALLGFLLTAAIAATSIYAPEPKAAVARVVPNIIGFFAFLYLLSPFCGTPRTKMRFESVASVYIAAATVVALYYVINFFVQAADIGLAGVLLDRVTGGVISLPWGATNVVASLLLLPMLLTFYFSSRSDKGARSPWYMFARTAMVAAILLTQSRGAMISGAFGLLLLALFFTGRARVRLVVFVAVTAFLWTMFDRWVSSVVDQQVVTEIVARFTGEDVADLNGRVDIWQQFISEILRSPIIGSGYYSTLYTIGTSGHNVVLTTLTERGVIGLALSSAILIWAGYRLTQAYFNSPLGDLKLFIACLGSGGAASVLHLMVEDANFTQQYIVYSWVALALAFQVLEVVPDEQPEPIRVPGHNSLSYTT